MKRVKFLLVFVFLLIGTLTVLAFSNDKYHKLAFVTECIKYDGIQPPYPSDIVDSTNWSVLTTSPITYCRGGFNLCAICYDKFTTTSYQARQILADYVLLNGNFLPQHGQTIVNPSSGKWVTVYLKDTE